MRAPFGALVGDGRAPGWLHRVDPLIKLAWLVGVVIFAVATYHPWPLLVVAIAGFAVGISAGEGARIGRILLIFAPVTASMLVIQTLAPTICATGCVPVAQLGPLALHEEGMIHGLSLAGRLLAVETVALAAIATTHPSDLFAALARLRVPYVANLIVAMTLQLIPILQREFAIVLAAQRSRGMRDTGFRAVLPSFVPVFAGAFQRVQHLTISLESRGFGASRERTSYRTLRTGPGSAIVAIGGLAAGVAGAVAGVTLWQAGQVPVGLIPTRLVVALFGVAVTLFVGVILAGIRALARA